MWPVKDLSHLPDDWLDAFLQLINEDDAPGERFASRMQAIFRMQEIESREGRALTAHPKSARIEKLKREGKPFPVERDQLYDHDGTVFQVGRVSVKAEWAELRTGEDARFKRHPLPLPADFRLIGWTR